MCNIVQSTSVSKNFGYMMHLSTETSLEKRTLDDTEAHTTDLKQFEVDIAHSLDDDDEEQYDIDSDRSPYIEVRAVIPEIDDIAIPVNTLRMWIIGLLFTLLGAGVNQFFSLRYPSVKIVSLVAELLAFPCGVFLAKILPLATINLGPLGSWCINPDRHFNIKEHALITIMSNVSFGAGSADATKVIQAAAKFYGFEVPAGFRVLMVICCQMLGYGVAGLAAPWLVQPASIIWPGVLSNAALLSTLHSRANAVANGWRITRLRFFFYITSAAFIWYWFPGFIFTGLSFFTWVCWIAPNNVIINQVFGMVSGLGVSPITFDWGQIAFNSNPLLSPHWAAANVFAGFAIFFWIVVPALYYTNTWSTAYLPISSYLVFTRTGETYDVSQILTNGVLDVEKYKSYSPPYLPATFAFVYALSFAAITGVLTHIALFHGSDIMQALRGTQKLDIHARLMQAYKKVPWWWFASVTAVILSLAIAMNKVYRTELPVWGVFLAFLVPAVYMIPCGIIEGITNVNANQLNVLAEFIGGFVFAGKPMANMVFKFLSTDVVGQGLYFSQDMKLAHYMKIPPRTLFFAQGVATLLGALSQVGVVSWMLANIEDVCTPHQASGFVCPNGHTIFSSSVIWGLIGPGRLYATGKIYSSLLHFFWIGALAPAVTWLLWKKTGYSFFQKVNWPLIFAGTWNVPPASGINYSSWYFVNLVFNKLIYRRAFAWWSKYNYILAAGLDSGLAICGLVMFFCVTYPGATMPQWWGNSVWLNTADGLGLAWKQMPEVGYFGGANGTWS